MSKPKRRRAKGAQPPKDGFYWLEVRNGIDWAEGWHNGSDLGGADATAKVSGLLVAITRKALESSLYGDEDS